MAEDWKPAAGFPGYEVSDRGEVRNAAGEPLSTWPHRDGYQVLNLRRDGRAHRVYLHRLVLDTFRGEPVVRHLDGDLSNNDLANLTWATREEAQGQRETFGTMARQHHNGRAKLNVHQVQAIRAAANRGKSHAWLADKYGVRRGTVTDIVRRRTWRDV